MTDYWEEIEELPKKLASEIFFVENRFKAPLMAGNIVFHLFDINDVEPQVNRGFLVSKDNKEIYRYNGGYYENDGEEKIKGILQQTLGLRSCDRYKNEVISWIRDNPHLQVERDIFNAHPNKINLENGTYDIESETFVEHDCSHFFNYQIPVRYNKNAKMKTIKEFLQTTLSLEDIILLQEIVGYCLYRRYHIHKGVIEVGAGRNGKSTLNELITTFLGDRNVCHVPLQKLCQDRFSTWQLYGKLANICSDLSSKSIEHTGGLKMLTGGDHIFAEKKHQDGFNFVNTAKLIFSCNVIPEITDKTKAMAERIVAIEFTNTFDKNNPDTDKNLLQKMTSEKELSGFLNFAIEGLQRLLSNEDFSDHRTLEDVEKYLAEHQNPVRQFVDYYIVSEPKGELLKGDVYNKYLEFCKGEGIPTIASNQFTQKFKQYAPFSISEGKSRILKGKTWKGVSWVSQQEKIL